MLSKNHIGKIEENIFTESRNSEEDKEPPKHTTRNSISKISSMAMPSLKLKDSSK